MNIKSRIELHRDEIFAYVSIVLFSLATIILASCKYDYISQLGSIIIVIGILLGTSRRKEKLIANFKNFCTALLKECKTEISSNIREQNRKEFEKRLSDDIDKSIEDMSKSFIATLKYHEVFIVIMGTLLNGFGNKLFCLFFK
ncbi:hypothetical protein [Dickeya zeae]|uniref:hypothetical protein n=1 Tax=Dickeya zeae TaxID=204042 RepID=UPI0020977D49|nr:hypothetical protein [Dickeya zeae]